MPSGRTHDSITLWSLPLVAGITFGQTQSASLTLFLSGGYLFSGLMFGPDLDIYSRQYQRWGILRWLWLPYRRSMRHRSFLSHGPIVGTIVRLLYLLAWLVAILAGLILLTAIACTILGNLEQWTQFTQRHLALLRDLLERLLQHHSSEAIALILGMELGAMSHACSDWLDSAVKRQIKRHVKKATPAKPTLAKQAGSKSSPSVTHKKPPAVPKPTTPLVPTTVDLPPLPRPAAAPDSQVPPFNG